MKSSISLALLFWIISASASSATQFETYTIDERKILAEPSGCVGNNQKSSNALPPGAPLPDIALPKDDNITAIEAFKLATESDAKLDVIAATEFYERAVAALRNANGKADRGLILRIIGRYIKLLNEHQGMEKATKLRSEFLIGFSPCSFEKPINYKAFFSSLQTAPQDANLCSVDPSAIDEEHYSSNRAERRVKPGSRILKKGSEKAIYNAAEDFHGQQVSAINAFISARSYEHDKNFAEALYHYELAIQILRNNRVSHDDKLVRQVARKYAHFLRNQNQREKAKTLEREFFRHSASAKKGDENTSRNSEV